MTQDYRWWQTSVIYQIYPRSFQDSNHDGIGDLPGILSRLDYLQWLGIDAIWLSPIYPSPMVDCGYDVANYTAIDPVFGTLSDFDQLLAATHERGMKLILDFVPNHTSDEHPWFVAARSSRSSAYRDWYIWRDPAPDGGPPNNWLSHFGGPAWAYDAATGQYYLHLFDPKQPDLNWRNPQTRAAMYDVLRFWLGRGLDGFRIDVIWLLIKDAQFRDNPPNPDWKAGDPPWTVLQPTYTEDQPEVHGVIAEMRRVFDEYPERLMIGEIYLPTARLMDYYGPQLDEIHLPFNFALPLLHTWEAARVENVVEAYEAALPEGAWPNWVLGNHDQPRVASRIGAAQSRIAHMLLLTLRGTPTCYYGDEIALPAGTIPPHRVVDPQGVNAGTPGRDPARTPMQWDNGPHAGFSTAAPWLPVSDDYATRNVAAQRTETTSMLTLLQRLLQLRRSSPALQSGSYHTLHAQGEGVFAYLRITEEERMLVVLNFTAIARPVDLSAADTTGTVLCSTHLDYTGEVNLAQVVLRPDEGLLIALPERADLP